MNFAKKAIFSVVFGVIITGIGIGFMEQGGVGPCGPSSGIATIGYEMTIGLLMPLLWLIPPHFERYVTWLPVIVIITVIPTLFWSLVMFAVLSVWSKLRQMLNKQSSDIPTPSPPPESLPPTSSE